MTQEQKDEAKTAQEETKEPIIAQSPTKVSMVEQLRELPSAAPIQPSGPGLELEFEQQPDCASEQANVGNKTGEIANKRAEKAASKKESGSETSSKKNIAAIHASVVTPTSSSKKRGRPKKTEEQK